MGRDLFDDCEGGEDDISKLSVDRDFARRFEHNKRREALQRLKELKRQGCSLSSSDEDDDDEEKDSELVPGKKDLQFLNALLKVKNKDPVLNKKDAKLFSSDDDEDEPKPSKNKKEKPLYLKDVMALHLIEEGSEFDDEHLRKGSKVYKPEHITDIKAFLEAEEEAFGSDDDDGEFIKEKETQREAVLEDEDTAKVQKRIEEYFGKDDDLDQGEMFLKSFFRDKMWIDKDKDKKPLVDVNNDIGVSEDENELEKQDKYEAEYNFRHEELKDDDDRVHGFSREIEGSIRKKTSSRKVQRKSKEARMTVAEQERREELKHLKNVKKKEIQEKLEKIRAIAGLSDGSACCIDEDDLEEDFDPKEYDKKMRETFDDDYYNAQNADPDFGSGDEGDLEKKPDFAKEDELLGLPKDWEIGGSTDGFEATRERILIQTEGDKGSPEKDVKAQLEEEGDNSDEAMGKRKKKKRKISLKEKVELDKILEEYYKLDYEDTIGDIRTRFKYKSVPPNRYGLRSEEILMARDKDLNQYVSLKWLAPYRPDEWKVTYHQKLKKELILKGELDANKKKKKQHFDNEPRPVESAEKPNVEEKTSQRRKRRLRQAELKLSRSRLMAYGKILAKSHKKH